MRRAQALPAWLLLLCGACSPAPADHPNVLLITVDTLRADHLSCYGYSRPTSPAIDRIAAEGLVFTHAQSPRAKTTPALASLMTGLYPHGHGVRELLQPLSPSVPVLAENLRRAGFRTGAVVGNYVLKREHAGLARGFDLWVDAMPDRVGVPPDDAPQRRAASLTDAALVALGLDPAPQDASFAPRGPFVRSDAPWFLWLHYMDPHGAYDPPPEHRVFDAPRAGVLLAPGSKAKIFGYNAPPDALLPDGAIDAGLARDRYDGEIRYVDTEIGRLVERLRVSGALDHTLLVLTADHGESLGEHDYWFEHGLYACEATCRVPLVVRGPGIAPGRRAGDIALADVAPTLLEHLELSGLGLPKGHGIARNALLEADATRPHPVFSEKLAGWSEARTRQLKAVRIGDWKLVRGFTYVEERPGESLGPRRLVPLEEELYDLAADPAEAHDLAATPPADAPLHELRQALVRFTAADTVFEQLGDLLERHRRGVLEGEAAEVLRQLGYL